MVEQHRPRREDDRTGHQNDELLRREPAHVADRQPEAVPEELEQQRVDVLQSSLSRISDRTTLVLISIHFDSQSAGFLERVMATTTVYPRLFEISITLSCRADVATLMRLIVTPAVSPRLFEISSTLTFRALHGNHMVSIPFETIIVKKKTEHRDVEDLILK